MSKRGRPAKVAKSTNAKGAPAAKKAKIEAVHDSPAEPTPGKVSVPQIGTPAPAFTVSAVSKGEITEVSLSQYKGKWVVLFFYPLDFTFVCPTEILAFSNKAAEFEAKGAQVLGASIDSVYSHLAWTKTPLKSGGLGDIKFPLLADVDKKLSSAYGALYLDTGFTLRATYIIDPKGEVRHISMNQPPVGRNVDELIRLVEAFQFHDKNGEVCPANWKSGDATMVPDPEKSKAYFEKHH